MIMKPKLLLAAALTTILLCGASCATGNGANATTAAPVDAITTEIYPVKDIVFARKTAATVETRDAYMQLADLVQNLREATDPKYWATDGASIRSEDSGYIEVKASPAMQRMVEQVLADVRSFQAKRQGARG